ncbi:MAG TPA: tetratricopeptide repeat protein [Vicinamibacterales bacterium]|nr:tetratricopeptide repeat protein [Vicinamibacterales bacterium]
MQDLATTRGATPGARDRMTAALAEWDRQIGRLQSQIYSEADGPDRNRAFQRRLDLGLMYRRRGRLDEALRQFDTAAALRPGASDVHLLRAMTLEWAGNADEAGRAYQAAWSRDAANPVKAYLALRRTRSIEAASADRARNVLSEAYGRVLSGSYRPLAPPFLTLDLVPDASSSAPIAGEARMARVFAQLAAGRLDEAAAALRVDGPATSPDDSAVARIARGGTAEREGRLTDARREYAAALEGTLSGRHALYVGIARLAQVEGDLDAAIDAFGHAVRLSPNDPVLRREFAGAFVAAGRFDDAFGEFVAALLIAPDNADVLAAVGQMFLDTDRAGDAIAPLRRALAVKADRYETHYALAVALSRAGQTEEAAREFERFERLSRQAMQDRRRVMAGQAGGDGAKR